jgi:MoxR-like ATPase
MNTQHLIEVPSAMAIASSMAGQEMAAKEKIMNLGILSRAFLKSQNQPVILLIDELDKVDGHIDTFFLGPLQDARIWLESRAPIDCNIDNLLIIFTKNYNRRLDDAFLRRVHPLKMSYIDSTLERRVLSKDCMPQLVDNLVWVAERMRNSEGSYQFERPPAPEELLAIGRYIQRMLEWNNTDFGWIGKNVWAMVAKSEHDRAVLQHMLRFHPDFLDPLYLDGKNATIDVINARLGRIILQNIVDDPDRDRRERAWLEMEYS